MVPAARAQNLLYVSDEGANDVDVYAYPAGTRAGKLTNLAQPAGLCTDTLGDVWVVQSSSAKITEFGHGGAKPIATLTISGARRLLGCAVDPTTGNLAVTDLGNSKGGGSLWVFAHAQGTPKNYRDPKISFAYFDGYDLGGNLFVDGLGAQLPTSNSPSFRRELRSLKILLVQKCRFPGRRPLGRRVRSDRRSGLPRPANVGDLPNLRFRIARTGERNHAAHRKLRCCSIYFWSHGRQKRGARKTK